MATFLKNHWKGLWLAGSAIGLILCAMFCTSEKAAVYLIVSTVAAGITAANAWGKIWNFFFDAVSGKKGRAVAAFSISVLCFALSCLLYYKNNPVRGLVFVKLGFFLFLVSVILGLKEKVIDRKEQTAVDSE
jgi:hypothetical protein